MPNSLAFGKDKAALKRMFFGRSSRLEMDAAGRIRLPEKMRSLVGLGKDVVLIGCGDCFEIANRDPWNEGAADDLKLMAELVEKLETAQAGEQAAG
jgi:MraZ protein